jgi:hypothetical protein
LIQEPSYESGHLGVCLARVPCSQHVADPILCPDQQFADNGAGHRRSRADHHKEVERLLEEPFKEEIEEIIFDPRKFWKAAASLDEHRQALAAQRQLKLVG